MRIHVLQHVSYEGPGFIEEWIKEKNHSLTFTKFYENYTKPDISRIDWLIIMGGPMGIYDEDKYPWLSSEKILIKSAIDAGKIILGICLGAQLIASCLNKKVFPNMYKEIGWFKIKATPEAKENKLFDFFPEETKVFHWHGDTFDLPADAIHIAASDACKNQAFVYKEKIIGLQFHLEITESLLKEMKTHGSSELIKDKFIQSETALNDGKRYCKQNNLLLRNLLDGIVKNFG